ncbi:MAG: hypothetical protein R3323_02485, partial [Wenzhouxiangellaceae bacterium]|nr:hypothetical protein [Wenzhouxiangellaceae bacterium]
DSVVIAFSKATDNGAFIGTRRALHTAYGTQCFAGTCNFGSSTEREDGMGRRIYVEQPRITVNGVGQGVLTFRQLGTDTPLTTDAPGVLASTGELMQLVFELDPLTIDPVADPISLTSDGAVNWHLDAVFDPMLNVVVASAVQDQALGVRVLDALGRSETPTPGVSRTRLGSGGVMLATRSMQPDFELLEASLSQGWIPAGGSATLTVALRNNGADWTEPQELEIATFWDGPSGLGLPGPVHLVSTLAPGKRTEIAFGVPLPAEFEEDDLHDLHVVINPDLGLAESDGTNNAAVIEIGAMPIPEGIGIVDGRATGSIVVQWDPIEDPRVAGYRVWRENPDGSIVSVGSSPVPGFVDFSPWPGDVFRYFVTSHSARLMESEPSTGAFARTGNPDLVFGDGFEN